MKKIILIGCGGHAKSITDSVLTAEEFEIAGFLDNSATSGYRGYKTIGTDENLKQIFDDGIEYAFVCIGFLGESKIRNDLYTKLKNIGFKLPVIIDPSAVIAADVTLDEGTFVGKNVVINSNSKVGKMTIINSGAIIEHDCVVGDYSHISVACVLCGNVKIGNDCLIGANSTVIQGISIGDNVIVGAASLILNNIEDNKKVIGIFK